MSGVPLISPVFGSIDRPFGRVGDTDQDVAGPPLDDGIPEENAESLVKENGLLVYPIEEGGTSMTVMSMLVFALPPVLLAYIV